METFENPVWTIEEVESVVIICIGFGSFLVYHLIDSGIEVIKQAIKAFNSFRKFSRNK
jgi:hypothetical protein